MEKNEKRSLEKNEAEAMKDVMNLLETEPTSETDHREQLAILVASGNCKEMELNLRKNKSGGFQKKMLKSLRCLQNLAMQ